MSGEWQGFQGRAGLGIHGTHPGVDDPAGAPGDPEGGDEADGKGKSHKCKALPVDSSIMPRK